MAQPQSKLKDQTGFSVLEILLAMAIAILTISAVLLVSFGSQSLASDSQTNGEAQAKAQGLLETEQANGRQDFNNVNALPQPPLTYITDGIYQKKVDVVFPLDPITHVPDYSKKQVTATVSWTGDHNRAESSALSTLVTNPQAANSGGTCNSVMANPTGWKTPHYYAWDFGQLGVNGNNGNGFGVADVYVYNQRFYVAMNTTPNTDRDTFFVFDLPTDPSQKPVFRGSVDNSASVSGSLSATAVAGNYAFLANGFGANFTTCTQSDHCAQLQVMDVTDPANPSVAASYKIPGVTGTGGQAEGKSIFYSNGYIYLGLSKTNSGPEFDVIDVGGGGGLASPTNPIYKGGYAVGNAVNSIFVKGNYAYIATPNSENMTVIDISNPANPTRVGGYTPAGGSNGESVTAVGSNVYLGRTFGTTEFYILNAANPGAISVAGSKDIGSGNQTSVNGMAVRDYLAFLITPAQFQVWNIANPASIQPWSSDGTTNSFLSLSTVGGTGTALYCSGDYFYLAVASSQGNTKDIISIITPGP